MPVLLFRSIALVSLATAGYFYSIDNKDGMFAGIVVAICSFFLSLRFRAKSRIAERSADEDILPK